MWWCLDERTIGVAGQWDPVRSEGVLMTAEVVLAPRRPWLAAIALVVASAGVALGAVAIASDDAGTASRPGPMAADTARIVVHGPVAGEACGLRIRGNVPC
jgi:hypothetical protein